MPDETPPTDFEFTAPAIVTEPLPLLAVEVSTVFASNVRLPPKL